MIFRSLEEAIAFYSSFGHYTLEGEAGAEDVKSLCPLLQFWIQHGNRKVIEWTQFISGEQNWRIEEESVDVCDASPQCDDDVVPVLDLSIDPSDSVNFDFSSEMNCTFLQV